MNLGFRTVYKGQPTHFPEKIMNGLFLEATADEAVDLGEYVVEGQKRGLFSDGFAELPPKLHTLRKDHKMTWKEGTLIHFTVGMRTKNHFRFAPVIKCTGIQEIEITVKSDYLHDTEVKIDGRILLEPEVQELAWNDGFSNLVEFWLWFNEDFKGKIIHWTDLRY